MITRKIKFDYYTLMKREFRNKQWLDAEYFDFMEWISYIEDNGLLQTTIQLVDTKGRIEQIEYCNDLWVVRVMKLREDNFPYIAKENNDVEDIELDEDEYVAEDMYILYDQEFGVAMVQSNRFSLGTKRLGQLLVNSQQLEDTEVIMRPLLKQECDIFGGRDCRAIEFTFGNKLENRTYGVTGLGALMNSMRRLNGYTGSIKISVGRDKEEVLNEIETRELIREIKENPFITSAKAKMRDDDLQNIEIVDLIEDCVYSIIKFNIATRGYLEFDQVLTSMIFDYNKKRETISTICENRLNKG